MRNSFQGGLHSVPNCSNVIRPRCLLALAGTTAAELEGWPVIKAGGVMLIGVPMGAGQTLAAFMAAVDELVISGQEIGGTLPDEIAVVYVSPLKAVLNDIRLNLEV